MGPFTSYLFACTVHFQTLKKQSESFVVSQNQFHLLAVILISIKLSLDVKNVAEISRLHQLVTNNMGPTVKF